MAHLQAFLVFVNDEKLLKWGFDLEEFLKKVPDYTKEMGNTAIATLVIQFMYLLRDAEILRLKMCTMKCRNITRSIWIRGPITETVFSSGSFR